MWKQLTFSGCITIAALLLLHGPTPAFADPVKDTESEVLLDDPRGSIIRAVEHYLNGFETLRSRFTQIAPDGTLSTGVFYWQRPGKLRWEYDPPVPVVIVANRHFVVYYDKELQQVNHVPAENTPAAFLTEELIRLENSDVLLKHVEERGKTVQVQMVQREKPDEGMLTLVLANDPMRIEQMNMTNAGGQTTQVILSNLAYGEELEKELFHIYQFKSRERLH